jgi:hypothetical protein
VTSPITAASTSHFAVIAWNLPGGQGGVAQQHLLEVDVHAGAAVRGELGGGAGDARGAEVLDALDGAGREQLEAALDEDLLHEGVADLHARALDGAVLLEGLRGEDRGAADAVAARARTEEHHLVARAGGGGEVDVLMAQHAERERVDQGVGLVRGVEDGLPADVRQAEGVAVAAHPGDHAVHDALGVGVVDRAEAQLVHHGDRPRAHRDDVAHDAADAGRGALVRLDVGGVVVGLDLEGHGPAVADVDDAGVLAHAHQELLPHLLRGVLPEGAQVLLRGLVRAVLGPHHRVHGELGVGGPAAQDLADARVLVVLEPELRVRLELVRRRGGVLDGVGLRRAAVRGGGSVLSGHRGVGSVRHEGWGSGGPTGRHAGPPSLRARGPVGGRSGTG